MKILLAIDEYDKTAEGGSNLVASRLVNQLSKQDEVAILTSHREGKEYRKLAGKPVVYSLRINYLSRFRAWLSLYNPLVAPGIEKALKDFKPDVVHVHTIHMYLTYDLLRIAQKFTKKVIFTGHDVMPVFYNRLKQFKDTDDDCILDTLDVKVHFFKQWWDNKLHFFPLRNLIIKQYLKQVDVVCVSKALKEIYQANGIKVNEVVHNGIDLKEWEANRFEINRFRKKHLLKDKKVILLSGRLREDKGSLQAVKLLAELGDGYLLIVAGKLGGSVGQMLGLIQRLGIKDRIIPLGFLNQRQLKVAYHASNIILVPSICFDSFPNAVIEGMACGKVVVATKFGGAKEVIEDGISGVIINPFDINQSVEKIKKILGNDKLTKNIENNAVRRIRQSFNIKKQVSKYQRLFKAN